MLAANPNSYHQGTVMLETKTKILVCNAGSSSLKFSLFEADGELLLAEGGIDWTRKPTRLVFRRIGHEEIRKRVCEKLNYLGLELDRTANETCKPDADVAMPASATRTLVIATREDLTIMREIRKLVGSSIRQPLRSDHVRPH
jgi:acetate kinase